LLEQPAGSVVDLMLFRSELAHTVVTSYAG